MKIQHLAVIIGIVLISVMVILLLGNHSMYYNLGVAKPIQISKIIIPMGAADHNLHKNFEPSHLKVILGINNTVIWEDHDNYEHILKAIDKSDLDFYNAMPDPAEGIPLAEQNQTNILEPGKSFEYTFTKSGNYGYYSMEDPEMRGYVLVLSPDEAYKQMSENKN